MTQDTETAPATQLIFDRGTLILDGERPRAEPPPGFAWDERVGRWRAPAYRYREVVAALRAPTVPFVDLARPERSPVTWRPTPPLRPYQATALDAWDAAGRRGVVVMPTGSGKTHVALGALARSRARAGTRSVLCRRACCSASGTRSCPKRARSPWA